MKTLQAIVDLFFFSKQAVKSAARLSPGDPFDHMLLLTSARLCFGQMDHSFNYLRCRQAYAVLISLYAGCL